MCAALALNVRAALALNVRAALALYLLPP